MVDEFLTNFSIFDVRILKESRGPGGIFGNYYLFVFYKNQTTHPMGYLDIAAADKDKYLEVLVPIYNNTNYLFCCREQWIIILDYCCKMFSLSSFRCKLNLHKFGQRFHLTHKDFQMNTNIHQANWRLQLFCLFSGS